MRITNDTIFNMATNFISIDTILGKHKTQAHVAFVMNRGKVIAVASNSVGSRSRGSGYGMCTIHAERAARDFSRSCGPLCKVALGGL